MNELHSKDLMINNLVLLGLSREGAEELYENYEKDGKLPNLQEYIFLKLSFKDDNNTILLRDI